MDIMAKAVMKKNAMTRRGRLWKNSIQRSLILTLAASLSFMTTRSRHWLKQKMSRVRPVRA